MSRTNEVADCVKRAIDRYFCDLDGEQPSAIYDMVISTVEVAMIETVLQRTEGNQTLAATMLGINRNTLRKKIGLLNITL